MASVLQGIARTRGMISWNDGGFVARQLRMSLRVRQLARPRPTTAWSRRGTDTSGVGEIDGAPWMWSQALSVQHREKNGSASNFLRLGTRIGCHGRRLGKRAEPHIFGNQ